MLFCTICGEHYHAVGSDRIDICAACWRENFSGAQELQPDAPSAREALEAYAFPQPRQLTLSPRQVNHLRRMQARWEQTREED